MQIRMGKTSQCLHQTAYAYGVCHVHGNIWKQRRFFRADGTPVGLGEALVALFDAIHLLNTTAIIKSPAHQDTDTLISKGNQ